MHVTRLERGQDHCYRCYRCPMARSDNEEHFVTGDPVEILMHVFAHRAAGTEIHDQALTVAVRRMLKPLRENGDIPAFGSKPPRYVNG